MSEKAQQSTWVERIADFKASGQSVPKWCKANYCVNNYNCPRFNLI